MNPTFFWVMFTTALVVFFLSAMTIALRDIHSVLQEISKNQTTLKTKEREP